MNSCQENLKKAWPWMAFLMLVSLCCLEQHVNCAMDGTPFSEQSERVCEAGCRTKTRC